MSRLSYICVRTKNPLPASFDRSLGVLKCMGGWVNRDKKDLFISVGISQMDSVVLMQQIQEKYSVGLAFGLFA